MYSKSPLRVSVAGLLFTMVASVTTGTASGQESESENQRSRLRERMLKRFDQDGDGALSADERSKMIERLTQGNDRPAQGRDAFPSMLPGKSNLYRLQPGPFSVRHENSEIQREGKLPCAIRLSFPDIADENFPVIVFSHGAGGSRLAYDPLVEHWVSHGYVVVRMTHGDSVSRLSREQKRQFNSLKDYVTDGGIGRHFFDRIDDVRLVLDQLNKLETTVNGLEGKINYQRIGIGGHSYGAYTSQVLAGVTIQHPISGKRQAHREERFSAALLLSPQGTGGMLDEQSWSDVKMPVMVVTGSEDNGVRRKEDADWRMEAYRNLPGGHKFLTYLNGADHGLGGISGHAGSPYRKNDSQLHVVKSTTLAFWDAQLKNELAAFEFLRSDQLKRETAGQAYTLAE